jgi:V/A-type H+-transporting ATPase subunit D
LQRVSATRSELLARRNQISLAAGGRDLLKEKRTALMREFNRLSASALAAMQGLEEQAGQARGALGEAVALDGPENVGSAALAASGEVGVELTSRSVAGVPIVELEHEAVGRPRTGRGYSLNATTPRIDGVAEDFEAVLDRLLDVVAVELSLKRLAEEITRTTRRVNALEHVVIPRLEGERDYIAMVLNERELENRVRLMRAKARSEERARGSRTEVETR